VGLALPVLVGAAGYGTDMAQLYMWKRELQHSVDQAALAGAYALADNPDSDNYTTRATQEFNANQQVTTGFATTPNISLGSYDGGSNNSVIVSASATRELPFSGFLIGKPLTIMAAAQATFAHGASYKACLMALKKDASGTFTVGGNATVNASCGLGALSCEDNALTIGGSSSVITDSIVTCGTASVPSNLESVTVEHAGGLSDPFTGVPAPTPPSESAKTLNCPSNGKGTQYPTPGRYTGGFNVTCTVVMSPGVYVIDGGTLDLTSNKGNITGNNVMFVLRHGATVLMGGSGNGGYVNLSPMQAGDFVGTANEAYKDKYAGILVFQDTTGMTSPVSNKFNGNASVSVRGTFYLPMGDMQVNGNSNTTPLCFQLWARTLSISGNTKLSTTCSSSQTNDAGSSDGGVKLVA
jgi:hypothetical protein